MTLNDRPAFILTGKSLDVLKGLDTNSVDCIITDPPYTGFEGMDSSEAYVEWFAPHFVEMQRICRSPLNIVVSQPRKRFASFMSNFGFKTAINIKNAMVDQRGADAFFLCQTAGLPDPLPESECWPNDIVPASSHPNARCINKMSIVVKAMSQPGDVVLDSFCGSAAIGVACILLGRRYIGIEVNEVRSQEAISRVESALSLIPNTPETH